MTLDWEAITVFETEKQETPCDCCRETTVTLHGDLEQSGDWLAFYMARFTASHTGVGPHFRVLTGDWSDNAPTTSRWIFEAELNIEAQGFMLLDTSKHAGSISAIHLDRNDILNTPFAAEAFAMLDAIYMKDSRLKAHHQ